MSSTVAVAVQISALLGLLVTLFRNLTENSRLPNTILVYVHIYTVEATVETELNKETKKFSLLFFFMSFCASFFLHFKRTGDVIASLCW